MGARELVILHPAKRRLKLFRDRGSFSVFCSGLRGDGLCIKEASVMQWTCWAAIVCPWKGRAVVDELDLHEA